MRQNTKALIRMPQIPCFSLYKDMQWNCSILETIVFNIIFIFGFHVFAFMTTNLFTLNQIFFFDLLILLLMLYWHSTSFPCESEKFYRLSFKPYEILLPYVNRLSFVRWKCPYLLFFCVLVVSYIWVAVTLYLIFVLKKRFLLLDEILIVCWKS